VQVAGVADTVLHAAHSKAPKHVGQRQAKTTEKYLLISVP